MLLLGTRASVPGAGRGPAPSSTYHFTKDGLVAWYDFSDPTTLFTDAGTTPVSADGDAIYQANDKSGNGNHLVQATALNRPLYKVNIANGQSVARFASPVHSMAGTVGALASFTTFLVFRVTTAITTQERRYWALDGASILASDTDVGAETVWYANQAAVHEAIPGAMTSWHIRVLRVNSAASMDVFYNGGGPTNLDPYNNVTTAAGRTLGYALADGTMDFGCEMDFNAALSLPDIQQVNRYLGNKWGVTIG